MEWRFPSLALAPWVLSSFFFSFFFLIDRSAQDIKKTRPWSSLELKKIYRRLIMINFLGGGFGVKRFGDDRKAAVMEGEVSFFFLLFLGVRDSHAAVVYIGACMSATYTF